MIFTIEESSPEVRCRVYAYFQQGMNQFEPYIFFLKEPVERSAAPLSKL
jgi:hypothetical protein